MTYIPILYGIMTTVFITYVAWIWARYGVLPSISESYYRLPKNLKILFSLFCWGFAFPAAIIGNSLIMTLAGAGIIFVGAAAAFKENMSSTVHKVGAISGVILSQLAIGLQYGMWEFNIAFVSIGVLLLILAKLKKIKNVTWWLELLAFGSICIVFGIVLL